MWTPWGAICRPTTCCTGSAGASLPPDHGLAAHHPGLPPQTIPVHVISLSPPPGPCTHAQGSGTPAGARSSELFCATPPSTRATLA